VHLEEWRRRADPMFPWGNYSGTKVFNDFSPDIRTSELSLCIMHQRYLMADFTGALRSEDEVNMSLPIGVSRVFEIPTEVLRNPS